MNTPVNALMSALVDTLVSTRVNTLVNTRVNTLVNALLGTEHTDSIPPLPRNLLITRRGVL